MVQEWKIVTTDRFSPGTIRTGSRTLTELLPSTHWLGVVYGIICEADKENSVLAPSTAGVGVSSLDTAKERGAGMFGKTDHQAKGQSVRKCEHPVGTWEFVDFITSDRNFREESSQVHEQAVVLHAQTGSLNVLDDTFHSTPTSLRLRALRCWMS